MNWKEHLTFGTITISVLTAILLFLWFILDNDIINHLMFQNSKILIYVYYIPILPIAIIMGFYASIFPDVDIKTSKAFAITFIMLIIFALYYVYIHNLILLIFVLILMILFFTMQHRGIMHNYTTGIMIGILFALMIGGLYNGWLVMIYFIAGYWTHLLCDR